jgi:hypothetical protein
MPRYDLAITHDWEYDGISSASSTSRPEPDHFSSSRLPMPGRVLEEYRSGDLDFAVLFDRLGVLSGIHRLQARPPRGPGRHRGLDKAPLGLTRRPCIWNSIPPTSHALHDHPFTAAQGIVLTSREMEPLGVPFVIGP